MRFVLAIISFVLAAGLIGLGIAQRTVFAGPREVSLSTSIDSEAPVTIIDGAVLNAYPRSQGLEITGADRVFMAYGRTTDVVAWVGDTDHTLVTLNATKLTLTTTDVEGEANEVPDPAGADLWLAEFDNTRSVIASLDVPSDVSLVLVSDGVGAAPQNISVTWPLDTSAPWSGPLLVGGIATLIIGLVLLVWALIHARRTRGPRRKQPKMPRLPKQPRYKPSKQSEIPSQQRGRRSIGRGMIAVPVVLVSALALQGCSAEFWPAAPVAAPTPSATAVADPETELPPPAVTVPQLKRIVERIAAATAEADANRDVELAKTRLDGAALELRLANYAIRGADASVAALPAIPSGPVKIILPKQTDNWNTPRVVFAVIQDTGDETVAPVALLLTQASPRENYKVSYAVALEPEVKLPPVAPASLGTAQLDPDLPIFTFLPSQVAAAYGDILDKDVDAEFYDLFQVEGDTLRTQVGLAKKNEKRAALPTTAAIDFGHAAGIGETTVLATNDAGALVFASLNELETVRPVEAGAAVNAVGAVKALSGKTMSTKGISATYGDQLLFYVPPSSTTDKIVLLGFSQGLIAASELP